MELAERRYTVRKYSDKPLEQEKLDAILEAARICPTANNMQPHRIRVVQNPADLKKIDQSSSSRYGAGTVLIVCYDAGECWRRLCDGAWSGEIDVAIAVTHMLLQAEDIGVNSTWVMDFDPEKLSELFDIPPHITPVALVPLGYQTDDYQINNFHYTKKPLDELMF
jgi:nitroreductase